MTTTYALNPLFIHESNLIEDIDDQTADACGLAAWFENGHGHA